MGTCGDPSEWCSLVTTHSSATNPARRATRTAPPIAPGLASRSRNAAPMAVIVSPDPCSGGGEAADQPAPLDDRAGVPGLDEDHAGARDDLGDRHQDERRPPRRAAGDVV